MTRLLIVHRAYFIEHYVWLGHAWVLAAEAHSEIQGVAKRLLSLLNKFEGFFDFLGILIFDG